MHLDRNGGRLAIQSGRYSKGEVAFFALNGKLVNRRPIVAASVNATIPFAGQVPVRTGSYIVRVVLKNDYTGATCRMQKKITILQ